MDRRSFNGPKFQYKVMWRKVVGSGPSWHSNFTESPPLVVMDVGNFSAFDIKVQAVNELGEGPEPISTIGYSGEDGEFPVKNLAKALSHLYNHDTFLAKLQIWINVPVRACYCLALHNILNNF